MKKIITLAVMVLSSALSFAATDTTTQAAPAPVKNSMGYVDFGVGPLPFPLPTFGGGFRAQDGHHGFDVSAHVSTIVVLTELKGTVLYNYYFKPNLDSQFYMGVGGSVKHYFNKYDNATAFSPTLVFGQQYRNAAKDTRFFQVGIDFPTFLVKNVRDNCKFPMVTLTYGVCF